MDKFYDGLKVSNNALIECVPNISTGKNPYLIERIKGTIARSAEVELLHLEQNYDAQRSVLTLAGSITGIFRIIDSLIDEIQGKINMSDYRGVHPSIGALDVLPFVPLFGIDKDELVRIVRKFSKYLSDKYSLPIYYYGAISNSKNHLSQIRAGGYEGYQARIRDGLLLPDIYPYKCNLQMGATSVTVRELMVAFNLDINTQDIAVAKKIARRIREVRDKSVTRADTTDWAAGLNLQGLKVLAWEMKEFGCCQISTNIYNVLQLSLRDVFELVDQYAQTLNIRVTGSELIGMAPMISFSTRNSNFILEEAISRLKLDVREPFHPRERILEYKLEDVGMYNKLMKSSVIGL